MAARCRLQASVKSVSEEALKTTQPIHSFSFWKTDVLKVQHQSSHRLRKAEASKLLCINIIVS